MFVSGSPRRNCGSVFAPRRSRDRRCHAIGRALWYDAAVVLPADRRLEGDTGFLSSVLEAYSVQEMFDANLPLLLSLLLRVLGVIFSLFLLRQVGDRRFVFFTGLLSLMAIRQAITVLGAPPGIREVPGFIVSILTVVLVLYLLQYVRQEAALKDRMQTINDELRANQNRLQAVLEGSPDTIFLVDKAGRCREILAGTETFLDEEAAASVDRPIDELLSDEAATAIQEAAETTLRTDDSKRIEYSVERSNEQLAWYEARTAPLEHPTKESDPVLFTARDVTERKDREQNLKRFRRAIDTAGHAIYITNRNGTIEYVNPAFEEVTGYAPEEALGQTPKLLDSGQMADEYFADLWETILAGDVWEENVLNETKSGALYHAHQTIAPITDESGTVEEFVAIQTDITPLKERERQLKVLSRVLRHNLRNDMNVILGKAGDIQLAATGKTAADAAQIQQTSEGLLSLAETYRDILDLIETSESPRPISLVDRLRTQVQQFRQEYTEAHVTVEIDCPEETAVVAMPGIERAVGELLENAAVHAEQAHPAVTLRVEDHTDTVRIQVADTGPGIPAVERETLLGETEIGSLSHGTGLGLWFVYWIVTRSNGHLSFEENDPQGSIVTIELERSTRE